MSWTGSEGERKPQLPCPCPDEFKGERRYVSKDELEKELAGQTVIGFGKHRGKTVAQVAAADPEHLRWMLSRNSGAPKLRDAIRRYMG